MAGSSSTKNSQCFSAMPRHMYCSNLCIPSLLHKRPLHSSPGAPKGARCRVKKRKMEAIGFPPQLQGGPPSSHCQSLPIRQANNMPQGGASMLSPDPSIRRSGKASKQCRKVPTGPNSGQAAAPARGWFLKSCWPSHLCTPGQGARAKEKSRDNVGFSNLESVLESPALAVPPAWSSPCCSGHAGCIASPFLPWEAAVLSEG